MSICSFCGRPPSLRAGRLCLCPDCKAQLAALKPGSPTYLWYARAVRRAMFSSFG